MAKNLTKKTKKKLVGVFFKMKPEDKKKLKMYCVRNNVSVTDVILKGIDLVMKSK